MATQQLPGPPYPPTTASLGGLPTISVDVPIASVFLVLFIGSAVGHMTIFQLNRKHDHKFIMSGMMFGFSFARSVAMILRIVWACFPTDIQIAMASQIFVAAGVLILFVVNLLFAQRMVRAAHPKFGWSKPFSWAFKILYILIPVVLAMVITTTVQSFYTLDTNIKLIDRDILLASQTFLLFVAFLPIPLVFLATVIPRSQTLEKFGTGRWTSKVTILLCTSSLLCLGAGWRVGTNFMPRVPIENSPWYYKKAAFWTINFVVEVIVVYTYLLVRVDRRFHVPNGSRQAGGYSDAYAAEREKQQNIGRSVSDDSLPQQNEDSAKHEEDIDDKSIISRSAPAADVEASAAQYQNR